jgi:hypothetical protein
VVGRGAGRVTRGGVGGAVGVVVGAGSVVGLGFVELPGRPAGGSGVDLDVVVGACPAAGGLNGTGVAAAGTDVFFDPCELGLRRE